MPTSQVPSRRRSTGPTAARIARASLATNHRGCGFSFHRINGGKPDLLFVFGITGVREGKPTHEAGVNVTIIVQGTTHIYGTLGDSRCTVVSLTQKRLDKLGTYRLEARGFCTQPAHAVRGEGEVLVEHFRIRRPCHL